jgi:hypothetical protein
VDDERESPSYRIMELLKQRGAEVAYHDPHVPVIRLTREHPHWAGKSVPWDRETIARFDAVVIATAHACVKVSRTSRLGAVYRRHSERNGDRASCAGEVFGKRNCCERCAIGLCTVSTSFKKLCFCGAEAW